MNEEGVITTYALVFGSLFLVLLGGVFGFVLLELKQGRERAAWVESLQVAEAGLDYFHWCLNNEVEEDCVNSKDFYDLEGNLLGKFDLVRDSKTACGRDLRKSVSSTGRTTAFPDWERTVEGTLGRISVAKYAYLLNDDVWAGADREIRGFYHSNKGIRMDGTNQSLVTSAKESWLCTSSFGCDGSNCPSPCSKEGSDCRCPGVFTTSGNADPDLFDFPTSHFDFSGITVDLALIKDLAEPYPQEKYWPPVEEIDPTAEGYHFKLKSGGSVEVRLIGDLDGDWAYSEEEGWHYDYFSIESEDPYKTVEIGSSCPLMFVEDDLWIDGELEGRLTVASADLSSEPKETTVVLPSDIDYTSLDGSSGLGLVSEGDILISPDSPDYMTVRGILVAQKGHFGRNLYWWNKREKLEIHGSVVSNGRVGTKWSSGSFVVSGYKERKNYVDTHLIYDPPCFVPYVTSDFKVFRWEEVE